MLQAPTTEIAAKKLLIARKIRRLYFDNRTQIILCSKRPTLSATQLLAESNLAFTWRGRTVLFDKCASFFAEISNCSSCNRRCRVDLQRHYYEGDISFRNVDFITAVHVVMNASCGFEQFTEQRKDWGTRPKNYNFLPVLPRALAKECAVKLNMTQRALEFLIAAETKSRILPPCGAGRSVWRERKRHPPAAADQMLITQWAIPINK
jgi:hypothetical protein